MENKKYAYVSEILHLTDHKRIDILRDTRTQELLYANFIVEAHESGIYQSVIIQKEELPHVLGFLKVEMEKIPCAICGKPMYIMTAQPDWSDGGKPVHTECLKKKDSTEKVEES